MNAFSSINIVFNRIKLKMFGLAKTETELMSSRRAFSIGPETFTALNAKFSTRYLNRSQGFYNSVELNASVWPRFGRIRKQSQLVT